MDELRKPYFLYLIFVTLLGGVFVLWGLIQFPGYESKLNFILLLILVATAQVITTSVPVTKKAGITYSVAPAVSMAALPFFGPAAAAVVEAVSTIIIWLIKPIDKNTWKRSGKQLAFNTGMSSIAILIAGWTFLLIRSWFGAPTMVGTMVSWLLAALVYEQSNLWLLIIILRLQHGRNINPLQIWRQHNWATSFNILFLSLGGGLLAFVMQQYDWIGIVLFLLPILLSAHTFRLYARRNNLADPLAG